MKPLLALTALTLAAHAGEPPVPAPQITPARESSGWEFTTALYAPLMGLRGDIGVARFAPNHVDIPVDVILENLDLSAVEPGHRLLVDGHRDRDL